MRPRNARSAKAAEKTFLCVLGVLCVLDIACGNTTLFRQYEYDEEIYLSLDGSATVYVNGSLAALNALRGGSFDASPAARFDAAAIRAFYSGPNMNVTRVSQSRRSNRRFAHVRIEVNDIRQLANAAPFAWSAYEFGRDGDLFVYKQNVGAPSGTAPVNTGWTGRELVAFRLHLPSKIRWHNTHGVESRGNILSWEQPLSDRLRGTPVFIEARMDLQSILYTTLLLFGATFIAVAAAFVGVIWWVIRRPAKEPVGQVR
jgi:hypothetical protein